jgi:prepilin-type N-terminal cleavage/methylation domain-containing protein
MLIVHNKANRVSAYTLVELLVVIGILSIAFSFLYVGFGSGDGANLSSAQRTLAGLVKAARAQAILNNAEVRLIIHDDDAIAEIEKYRRFVGIVYKERNGAGWIAADKGTYLPKGIYFDSAASNDMSGANWSTASTMRINFPRLSAQSEGVGTDFLYYEFNSNGTSANSNAYLVFRAGKVVPGADDAVTLELPSAGEQKSLVRSGLLFRQSGTATLINEPEDIDI